MRGDTLQQDEVENILADLQERIENQVADPVRAAVPESSITIEHVMASSYILIACSSNFRDGHIRKKISGTWNFNTVNQDKAMSWEADYKV
jgi:hypothetical protein